MILANEEAYTDEVRVPKAITNLLMLLTNRLKDLCIFELPFKVEILLQFSKLSILLSNDNSEKQEEKAALNRDNQ